MSVKIQAEPSCPEKMQTFDFLDELPATEKMQDSPLEILDAEEKTDWKLISVAGVVAFLTVIENTVVGMSEWPYMKQIDKEATAQFFGAATSASKAGHAIFTLVFAAWSFHYKTVKAPLIAGRVVATIACILYLGVEILPSGHRYLMMFCYILFGIASSASTILRAYVVAISSSKDRPRAFTCISAATIFSIIIGPLVQLAFTRIPYPGYTLLPRVHLHVYSAPIWIASLTNFVAIAVILCYIRDARKRKPAAERKKINLETLKLKFRKLRKSNINWKLVILCWTMKTATTFSHLTFATILSIFLMAAYGWTGAFTVRIISMLMGGVGLMSITVLFSYMVCRMGEIIQQRFAFFAAMAMSALLYVITYPYPFTSNSIAKYDNVTDTGCDPSRYTWCETSSAVNPILLLASLVVVKGIAIPTSHVSLDTIYSRILGGIDQSVMQGTILVVEDIVAVMTPIYASSVFAHFGIESLWITNGVLFCLATFLWACFLGELRPFH
ncbi:unnamed protein product [Caenorhabditis auriculariae]|uniref:Major facilitator superfamily (MFS) profile domain-containing protein n=1 Tax=Caenorhabditis auriculariae TaxID=2777116 RepID=A0A8S1GVV4_9PELO|nr:unnamed protein product [Caenorhabditis auriculariae]